MIKKGQLCLHEIFKATADRKKNSLCKLEFLERTIQKNKYSMVKIVRAVKQNFVSEI